MTIVDDIVAQLRRGECISARRHAQACSTCDAVDRRIAHVLALDELAKAARPFRERGRHLVVGELVGANFIVKRDEVAERLDVWLATVEAAS